MTETLHITCPSCGTLQRVPLDRVPEQGGWGRCASCRQRIFVERPGVSTSPPARPELSDDTWSPASSESGAELPLEREVQKRKEPTALFLKTPEGKTIRCTSKEIEDRIRWQKVLPWDLVSTDGARFEPIQKNPYFLESFRGFSIDFQRTCWNHAERVAEKICSRCQRCYCVECLPAPAKEPSITRVCWACGGVLQDTDPGWRFQPYWRRLKEVIQFPKGQHALLATAGLALVLWVASLSLLGVALYLVGALFTMHVFYQSANGRQSLQEALQVRYDPSEVRDVLERGLLAFVIMIAIALPLVVVNVYLPLSLALVVTFFIALSAFWYHLMAIAVVMLSERPFAAFQPKVVIKQINAMGQDYPSLLLGLLLIYISFVVTHFVIGRIPLLGMPLTKVIVAYGSIVSAHMAGWTYYLNLGRLGWRRTSVV